MEINRAWSENYYVTKANLMHQNVHDTENSRFARGKYIYTSVPVYNDLPEYNLYGVTDCLECEKSLDVCEKTEASVSIVEYKPTAPKNGVHREEDVMQVFAQKLCVDETFGCSSDGYIYYGDTRKRHKLLLQEEYDVYSERLKYILKEMRYNLEKGIIPPRVKKQKCSGCSMKDICMPNLKKAIKTRDRILQIEQNGEW